jgi:hypothetical protein
VIFVATSYDKRVTKGMDKLDPANLFGRFAQRAGILWNVVGISEK